LLTESCRFDAGGRHPGGSGSASVAGAVTAIAANATATTAPIMVHLRAADIDAFI
jgi:hypothetical protein